MKSIISTVSVPQTFFCALVLAGISKRSKICHMIEEFLCVLALEFAVRFEITRHPPHLGLVSNFPDRSISHKSRERNLQGRNMESVDNNTQP